ncbi:MAG TPA: EamA family transporter [Candidatus Nanopelagicales bacterium]|nr:EamA family transporter [Candidatus Nanopelagicales bacterium]
MSITDRLPAWTLAVGSMLSVQLGAALSVRLFPAVGVAGTAWLRLTFGALIFLAWARPPLRSWSLRELRTPILLGVVTGIMTIAFLGAIDRLPLGTAVAIEFLGPLTVAAARARSRSALVWPFVALVGVLVLTEPWAGDVDVVGVLFALTAATGWGSYILLTQHVGDRFSGVDSLAISIPVAAVTAAFAGVPQAIGGITVPVLMLALLVAVLMPVIPFALELFALRRLTASAFGTLMALEPALGVLIGALLLAQVPGPLQLIGVALVVVAGIGAERTGHREDDDSPGRHVLEPPGI